MKESGYGIEFIRKLKEKNDIVSVISKYVRLEKKGRNFWGCCPFHHEKTPSFCINEYDQFYHCFGCGESGDVITFLRKYENMEYHEAIEFLAKNVGMEIPKFVNDEKFMKNKKIKDKSLEILQIAKEFYKGEIYLPTAKPAQTYIKSRNVTKKELENFELGYSPDYDKLVKLLEQKGYSQQDMKLAGVCDINKRGQAYDFLAKRLVFPIVNSMGDCIGFSGRDLENSGTMKYKNTSATLIFDKSKTVYAINLIKKLKQSQPINEIILVEGQFDVITMHRYGFENTVACLGTAITKEHIRELKRYVDNIVLCLDGDAAGRKATLRAIDVFDNSGLDVKVAVLPDGQDPDEYLKKYGSDKLKELIDGGITPMMFKIFVTKLKYNLSKLNEKTKFIKEILSEISKLESKSEQEMYLAEIKKLTGISTDVLKRDLKPSSQQPQQQEQNANFPSPQDASSKAVKYVLASHLYNKDYINRDIDLLPYLKNADYQNLFKMIKDFEKNQKKLIISSLFDVFDIENDQNLNDIINFNFEIIDNPKTYYQECLWLVIEKELKFRKDNLSKQYNEEMDQNKKTQILLEINNINKKLKNKKIGDF